MANGSDFNLSNFYNLLRSQSSVLYPYQFLAEMQGDNSLLNKFGLAEDNNGKGIKYYIQSATIPGVTLSKGSTTYLGTEFRVPGVLQFSQNFDIVVFLNEKFHIYDGFRNWQRKISDLKLDGGGEKRIPDVSIKLYILKPDSTIDNSKVINLEGVWVRDVQNISLAYAQGGGNAVNDFKVSLKYQYSWVSGIEGSDPLATA